MKRYLTDRSHTFEETNVRVRPTIGNPEMRLVKLYPDVTYQSIAGSGAALAEASG